MNRLIVYLNGRAVGALEEDQSATLVFSYAPEWLTAKNACPLSKSLPLRPEPFRGKEARPFFAGILPEQEPREKIAAILGISSGNDFAMLERIGGECAGAVSLLSEDVPQPLAGENRLRKLSETEVAEILAELPRRPLLAGKDDLRLSLAGAQNKLPIVFENGVISLPLGNSPSSHIIKPEPQRFPGLTTNELFCMKLAKAVGLKVPEIQLHQAGNIPCVIVTRYDRTIDKDGRISRLHQEDFCQALGFPPERKYQQEGGPLIRDCISLLREWSSVPALDIRDFLDGLIFNFLVGNADAHGKNFSMLYDESSRRLAPFYDLVCTMAWPELSRTPAMRIGKGKSLNDFAIAHFRSMALETTLGWPQVRERIEKLCNKLHDGLKTRILESASRNEAMAENVTRTISERTSKLLDQLKT